ncbi:MAG: presenilin family intramembrane aspartyl protease PSH [Halobacteriota archaeon]|jgi:presenilin-like A22 family membrane protease
MLKRISPFAMVLFIIAIQGVALLLAHPFQASDIKAFSDPESVFNPLYYVLLVLVFTAFLLLIIKLGRRWVIQLIMGLVIISTLYFVYSSVLLNLTETGWLIAIAATAVTAFFLFYYPEWWVIDVVGILIGAGAAAIFGISLAVVPALVLLVALGIYDFVAVYETKHMISLAEGVVDLKLPVLFVLPRNRGYSHVKWAREASQVSGEEKFEKREAFFMGLGDAVIPTVLVISANSFMSAPAIGFINVPALGAAAGTIVGYVALMWFVLKGKPQAGLPFLNSGAIGGFLIASYIVGVKPF